MQVVHSLERNGKCGSRRLKLSRTLRAQHRRDVREGIAAPLVSLRHLLERGAKGVNAGRSDGAGTGMDTDQPAFATPACSASGVDSEAAPADAAPSGAEAGDAAAGEAEAGAAAGSQGLPGGAEPTPAASAAGAPEVEREGDEQGDSVPSPTVESLAAKPALMNRAVRIVFIGAARQEAASLLDQPLIGLDQPQLMSGAVDMGVDHRSSEREGSAAASQEGVPTAAAGAPAAAASSAAAHTASARTAAARTTPALRASARSGGAPKRQRIGGEPLRDLSAAAPPTAAPTASPPDAQHMRNVLHMLAPALLADSGRGPTPVDVPRAATSGPARNSADHAVDAVALADEPATELAPLGAVLRFISALSVSVDEASAVLEVGVFELAQRLLRKLGESCDRALSPPLLDAFVSLDAKFHGDVGAASHLMLAELCVEAAHSQSGTAASAGAIAPQKRKLDGCAVGAGRGAAAAAETERNEKQAASLRRRGEQHLAAFHSHCCAAGGMMQAAATAAGQLVPNAATTHKAREWALRAVWLRHRAARHRCDHSDTRHRLLVCERLCSPLDGDQQAPVLRVHLPWCPLAPLHLAAVCFCCDAHRASAGGAAESCTGAPTTRLPRGVLDPDGRAAGGLCGCKAPVS